MMLQFPSSKSKSGEPAGSTNESQVATLYKTGNFRKVSGKSRHAGHTERNRRTLVILAVVILLMGLLSLLSTISLR